MLPVNKFPKIPGPIGVFDSGYGGLTILRQIRELMPQNDYIYLGDNARTPYGTRSYEVIYEFTLQAVNRLFQMGCHLVILACNTASAKALRSIQQNDLPLMDNERRVLGVIRPTTECIGQLTQTRHVGIVATPGTIRSKTYELEIAKLYPDVTVVGEACPMWVPLVENEEYDNPGADYFVQKNIRQLLEKDPLIDCIILGCTHYPILMDKIRKYTPAHVCIVPQGQYVASSLKEYLHRHPDMDKKITKNGTVQFYTTEQPEPFNESAATFLGETINAERLILE
jgi:glutamate racemase